MTTNEFGFPDDIEQRHQYIIDNIEDGNYELDWTPITINTPEHQLIIQVSKDVLKINGIRINVSARLQQQIADILDVSLITGKISDLIFDRADCILEPNTRAITTSTQAMIEYSQLIDKQLAQKYPDLAPNKYYGLVCTLGKDWILDNHATSTHAVNYGWHIESVSNSWKQIPIYPCCSLMKDPSTGSYFKVIQQPSTFHNLDQDDYSQKARYMLNKIELDGSPTTFLYVAKTPELAPMISYQGVINNLRQPGI